MARLEGEYERAMAEVKRQEQVFFQYREWARLNSKFASRARARLTLLERARSRVDKPQKRRDRTLSLSFASDARGRVMAEATGGRGALQRRGARRPGRPRARARRPRRADRPERRRQVDAAAAARRACRSRPAGRVRIKEGATVAMMTQESLSLDLQRTPLDLILDERAMGRDDAVRRICALGLDYEHCNAPLGQLSGGQRVRVHLLRVSLHAARPAAARRADELHRHALGRGRAERARGVRRLRDRRHARPLFPRDLRDAHRRAEADGEGTRVIEREGLTMAT